MIRKQKKPARGSRTAPGSDPSATLPPRLQRTLAVLLEGVSEADAAERLGLSRSTVHDYAVQIYRRFGISTRCELLVRCAQLRRSGGEARSMPEGSEGSAAEQADRPRDLPPRLQRTLEQLLRGVGERQAAENLGLSRHTVHEYVTELLRRFNVRSRAELLATCLRDRSGP
jgi:DNA-binding NarL/FixJ family response regulator